MGVCTSEGVVLAVEKRVTSTLMEPSSIEKILEIDSHIGGFVRAYVCGWVNVCGQACVCG